MLALEVLVGDTERRGLRLWIDLLGLQGHERDFLDDDGMLGRERGRLAPGKWGVKR